MNIEDISKRTQQHQNKLLMYKKNIEKFLSNKSAVSNPQEFNSTLFKAMPQESLVVSESARPRDNDTLPSITESNLINSKVSLTKEKNLLAEIDQAMSKYKVKGPTFPAEAIKKIIQKKEQQSVVNIIVNKDTSKATQKSVKFNDSLIQPQPKQRQPSRKKQETIEKDHLPPKPIVPKQKELMMQTIQKYKQLSKEPTKEPLLKSKQFSIRESSIQQSRAISHTEQEDNFFELSQTLQAKSIMSDFHNEEQFDHIPSTFETRLQIEDIQDSVLRQLYKQREHLMEEIGNIDKELEELDD